MQIKQMALVVTFATYLVTAHAGPPMDQLRISGKSLKGLVSERYSIVAYSNSYDPVSNALRSEYVLQKNSSVYLCNDNYRYKVATRELACYELVEPFNAQER